MPDPDADARFGAADVIEIASRLTADDAAFVVGGQATNLWAWLYRDRSPDLQFDEPLTSVDIDYYGSFRVAQNFAAAIGGTVYRPDADTMNSPSTAQVVADYHGRRLVIDFLNGILGVTNRELERGVADILVEADLDGVPRQVAVAVLHPVLCLKSRVANMVHPATRRRDAFAWRQLHAAIAVLRCYIDECLATEQWPEAKACFREMSRYLKTDRFSGLARTELDVDLGSAVRPFSEDERIDPRYRSHQLAAMLALPNAARPNPST